MKARIFLSLIVFCSLFSAKSLFSQNRESQIDSLLSAQFSSHEPGVVALVAHEGEVIYRKATGMANMELQIPLQPRHVFRIASITKQFTAIAILTLVEEGKLSLDDDIRTYIKEFQPEGPAITIEHLLTHTSGLGNQNSISNWDQRVREIEISPKAIVSIIEEQSLAFTPGSQYAYSNLGYWLLGYIIEETSGQAYSAYITQKIIKPLNLANTHYDSDERIIPNRIQGYAQNREGYRNATYIDMKLPYSGGGLVSTVDDLYTWNKILYSNKSLVSPQTLATAHQAHRLSNGQFTRYGYGWMIGDIQGQASIQHDGIINGFISYALYMPESETFVALLTNCDCTQHIDKLANKIAAIAIGKPYQYARVNLPKKTLVEYAGVYQSSEGSEKRISYQDGELMLHDKGGMKALLVPIGNDQFVMDEGLSKFTFHISADDKALNFTLQTLQGTSSWKKTSDETILLSPIKLNRKKLQKFVGKYKFKGAFTLEIYTEEDRIFGRVGDDPKEIMPYQPSEFFVIEMDARLIFNSNPQGEVTSLTFVQSREMQGEKIE